MSSLAYRRPHPTLGGALLFVGSAFPCAVILLELFTGLCASAFFDPLPTAGHLLLAGSTAIINGALWLALRNGAAGTRAAVMAAGFALAVAGAYTLLFLPILPFAAVAVIFFGLGFFPFAPVLAGAVAWRLGLLAATDRAGGKLEMLGGAALGLLALGLADLPATATHLALERYQGTPATQAGAVRLMRRWGDRGLLLRAAYGDTARATGLVSLLVSGWNDGPYRGPAGHSAVARELYFRATGRAFNAVPKPGNGPRDRMRLAWDGDRGGEQVGGRVEGLALASSRIDGSTALVDNLAYTEWTLEVANGRDTAEEARFTLALPEGAVASRATLWVDGEPREASVAGRAETRAAYRSVVSSSRDPLLVTTDGAQRLLVQVFPVAARGRAKLRIGYAAPFRIAPDGRRSLASPSIAEANFDTAGVRHALWFESDGPLAATGGLRSDGRVVQGEVADAALSTARLLARPPAPGVRVGGVPGLAVAQAIERADPVRPSALVIVLDGSAGNRAAGPALLRALDAIPAGVPVGLAVAGDEVALVPPVPWGPEQRARLGRAIRAVRFQGGQDDRDALAAALAHAHRADAVIFWVHGPQPVDLADTTVRLDQALARVATPPRLVRYQTAPGHARTVGGSAWFDTARFLSPGGDLRATLAELSGAAPTWRVTRTQARVGATGSAHIVRLWAGGRIAAASGATGPARDEAVGLAHRLNLVTPLSGAVVLETDKDYKANGLPVPGAAEVPTVPEPETWALIGMVAALALWVARRQAGAAA